MSEWKDQCPNRGPGLSHAHWKDCDPEKGGHPNDGGSRVGHKHQWGDCCHCEWHIEGVDAAPRSTESERRAEDHKYVPTMVGRCGRHGCGLPIEAHITPSLTPPEAEKQADESGLPVDCTYDHRAVTPKLLIGDEGYIWTSCPGCNVVLEPSMAKQQYPRAWGRGRGNMSPRDELRAIAAVGWRAWLALHGGGEGAPPHDD